MQIIKLKFRKGKTSLWFDGRAGIVKRGERERESECFSITAPYETGDSNYGLYTSYSRGTLGIPSYLSFSPSRSFQNKLGTKEPWAITCKPRQASKLPSNKRRLSLEP